MFRFFLDFHQRDILLGARCISNAGNRDFLAAEVGGNDL